MKLPSAFSTRSPCAGPSPDNATDRPPAGAAGRESFASRLAEPSASALVVPPSSTTIRSSSATGAAAEPPASRTTISADSTSISGEEPDTRTVSSPSTSASLDVVSAKTPLASEPPAGMAMSKLATAV